MFLQVQNLVKNYGDEQNPIRVLKGLSFELQKGEFCTVLGPSGSGKSTLLNIIGGIDFSTSGQIYIDGKAISMANEKELEAYRRNSLGFVFQFYNLIPDLSVRENIELCAHLSPKALDLDMLLKKLGLFEHQDKFAHQLSGGQQQRTSIGRALVKNPAILLCDEPTGALDYETSKEILELLESLNQEFNTSILMVTHNEGISLMSDRILKLKDGVIIENIQNKTKLKAKDLQW